MTLEVREIIFILIGLVAVYVVVQVLRAAGSRKAPAPTVAPQVAAEPPAVAAPTPAEPATPAPSRHDAVRERAEQLALELEVQQLRRDLRQLRTEHDNQRHELEHLAAELARMQEAVGTLQAGQRISPQYGEAVMLARRGLESEAIAERCGISVAEAALVRSLAQGPESGEGEHGG